MKRLFIIGLCILAMLLAACGSSNTNTGTLSSSPSATPTAHASPTARTQHFHVNDTVNVGNTWEVMVSAPTTSQGDQYVSPRAGNVFLLVPVTLKNVSNQEQQLSLLDWTLKDLAGQKYNDTYVPDITAPSGKVEAGDPAKGTLAYEVPSSIKEFRLSFQVNLFSSGQTIWDLTLP